MEQYDERLIALEADIRIMREEKRRVEEECQKLREENDNLSGRLDEVSNTQVPITTNPTKSKIFNNLFELYLQLSRQRREMFLSKKSKFWRSGSKLSVLNSV